jgi:predicted ATPase
MNPDQAAIYHTILQDCWYDDLHQMYFIDGKAGRGKTFLVRAICDTIRSQGDIVIIAGSTALSATLYERGRTAHSIFGIPVLEVSHYWMFSNDKHQALRLIAEQTEEPFIDIECFTTIRKGTAASRSQAYCLGRISYGK